MERATSPCCDVRSCHQLHRWKDLNSPVIKPVPGVQNTIATTHGCTPQKHSFCYSVTSSNPVGAVFLAAGDSGSIVVHDPSGAWLGLLFGASDPESGMMLPIDLVLADIEHVTGLKVVEPKFTVVE